MAAPKKKKSWVRNGVFYPNLGGVRQCEVTDGVTVNTTNDLGAYCAEDRSFMDYEFFKATFGDTIPLVKPQPRCKEVRGVRFEQPCKVIGMIPQLSVRIGKHPKGPTVLKGVLVVENFCVPLHLGLKNDRLDNVSKEVKSTWGEDNAPEHFPPKYRSHSHWQPSNTFYMGGPLSEVMMTDSESEDDLRDQLAKKYGWVPVDNSHAGTESWVKDGDRIDYYPNTDRCKTTLKDHPKDASEAGRGGNPHNKDLVRDNVGGNTGLEEIFKNLRVHTGTGRYHKAPTRE